MLYLAFLKFGGSLITDKYQPNTARHEVIDRLAGEIYTILNLYPELRLILGHGSGSFGHMAASKYHTQDGVIGRAQWLGFAEVWHAAHLLNQIVIESLVNAGLPAIAFPPSAGMIAEERAALTWDLSPITAALERQLLPVVNGDVIFDTRRGGTILSTEDIFVYMAHHLKPEKILIAGIEPGVWADYPQCKILIPIINPGNLALMTESLATSAATDVTGGMAHKVISMLALAQEIPGLEISIFSGNEPGSILSVLQGAMRGTIIRAGKE